MGNKVLVSYHGIIHSHNGVPLIYREELAILFKSILGDEMEIIYPHDYQI